MSGKKPGKCFNENSRHRFIADMLLVWQTAIAVKGRNREAVQF
jgi:hypothetical protein